MTVPSGLQSHMPPLAFSVGSLDWDRRGAGGEGSTCLVPIPLGCPLGPRPQAPGSPRGTFSGPNRAHNWASFVHRVEPLGCSFKNKFFLFSKKRYKNYYTQP